MDLHATLDELEKLGAVSPEQARRSLDRLDTLERNKPTGKQVANYASLGAVAGPAIGVAGNLLKGKKALDFGAKSVARGVLGESAKGAVSMGAVPLIRGQLDRQTEKHTLRKFMQENPSA